MVDIFSLAIGIYALLIAVIGTFGNLLIFITTLQVHGENNTTFIFLRFLSISDWITLFFFNLDSFSLPVYDVYLENISVASCKWVDFLQFASFQSSAWLLVSLSLDRCLSVIFVNWHRVYFNAKRAMYFATAVVIVNVLINIHILFTFGAVDIVYDNVTTYTSEITRCYNIDGDPNQLMNIWQLENGFMYSFIPFILIFLLNILLVAIVYKKKVANHNAGEAQAKFKSMTRSVMSITILFIFMTSPISVASIYYNELVQTYTGLIWLNILNSLCFSYHALNIFILLLTNKKFVKELKQFLKNYCFFTFRKSNKQSSHANSMNNSQTRPTYHLQFQQHAV